MKKVILLYLIFSVVLFSLYGYSNADQRIKKFEDMKGGSGKLKTNIVKIPFEIKGSHIIFIDVKINEQEKKKTFVFDTGGVTLLDKTYAKKSNFELKHLYGKNYYTILKKIEFTGVKINEFKPFVINFRKKFGFLGKSENTILYGMIGCDVLRFFKLTVDYETNNIILSDSTEQLVVKKGNQDLLKMKILLPYHPCIDVNFENRFTLSGRIDTGLHFAIVLPIHLIDKLTDVEKKSLIKSKGNFAQWPDSKIKYNYLYKFKEVKIGKFHLKNQAVLFADLPEFADKDYVLLGKHFLENYKAEMDFKNKKVLLTRINEESNKSLLYSFGLSFSKKNNKVLINGIWENSKADIKGLKINDEITNINGQSANKVNNKEIYNILMNKNIREVELKIKNKIIILKKEILL